MRSVHHQLAQRVICHLPGLAQVWHWAKLHLLAQRGQWALFKPGIAEEAKKRQSEVPVQDYWDTTYDELNILDKECLIILTNIIRQKERIAIHYNKKLRKKIFLNWRFGLQSSIVNG